MDTTTSEREPTAAPAADVDVVLRARAGDLDAFDLLVTRYSGRVLALALNLLRDRGEAEDVTQDTFLTAWSRLADRQEPAAVRTWLFRIAHRRSLEVLRRRSSRATDATAEVPEHGTGVGGAPADPRTHPERSAETTAAMRALEAAVARLPEDQRVVWQLAEIDELSYAEIAAVTAVGTTTVRGRLARARCTLAATMKEWA